jgi:elongation factor G
LPKPVLSFAIEPKSSADIDKVSLGLHKLIEEDPTLGFTRNADTKEMVLSGTGQLHLDLALEKLQRKYGAEVVIHTPKIPYRETIRATAQAQGKYKKQTGGHGQYGDCWLELSAAPRGEGFAFTNRVVGGVIPRNFIPAVEKGVVEAMQHGTLAGFPVVDVRVAVYDGSYHVVDSSEMSFKIAASMAFKKAMETAHPVLLEPMMTVEVDAPAASIGAVIGDLNGRRGRILHVEARGHAEVVGARPPERDHDVYDHAERAHRGRGQLRDGVGPLRRGAARSRVEDRGGGQGRQASRRRPLTTASTGRVTRPSMRRGARRAGGKRGQGSLGFKTT